MEFGVILWFSCILWDCNNPQKLWALNPKKLLLPDAGQLNIRYLVALSSVLK